MAALKEQKNYFCIKLGAAFMSNKKYVYGVGFLTFNILITHLKDVPNLNCIWFSTLIILKTQIKTIKTHFNRIIKGY